MRKLATILLAGAISLAPHSAKTCGFTPYWSTIVFKGRTLPCIVVSDYNNLPANLVPLDWYIWRNKQSNGLTRTEYLPTCQLTTQYPNPRPLP